jgi:hypothetical protein
LVINASDRSVRENGRLLRSGNDVFIPAAWRTNKEILAFSEKGYTSKTWNLPPDWKGVKKVNIFKVTENGLVLKSKNIPVSKMCITISLEAMEEVAIQPAR